jgi:hypothetical protein
MKAQRNHSAASDTFEFVRHRPRNVLRVERDESVVRIRAARDNFSEKEKESFVRYLAAEGFLPDAGSSFVRHRRDLPQNVEWHIDGAPFGAQVSSSTRSRRAGTFMVRLIVYTSLFWLLQLSLLFLTRA